MNLNIEIEGNSLSLRRRFHPSTTSAQEPPETLLVEHSVDFAAIQNDPDILNPEVINTPGLQPDEDPEEGPELEEEEVDPELDPELPDPELPDPIKPDFDLPKPDEVSREEIDSGVQDRSKMGHPWSRQRRVMLLTHFKPF